MSNPIQIPARSTTYADSDSLSDASTASSSPPESLTFPKRSFQRDPDAVIMSVFFANKMDLFLVQFCDNSSLDLKHALVEKNPDPLFALTDEDILRVSHADFLKTLFKASHGWNYERVVALPDHCSRPILTRLALYRIFHPIDYLSLYHITAPVTDNIRQVMKHKCLLDHAFKFRYPPPAPCHTRKLLADILEQVTPPALELYHGAMGYIEKTLASRPRIDRKVFKSFK